MLEVISDLTGLTGLAVLDAIVGGERDPAALAKLRDPRIKADEETIPEIAGGKLARGAHPGPQAEVVAVSKPSGLDR